MGPLTPPTLLAAASGAPADSLPIFALVTGLLGGLAIFLFGMEQMSESLKAIAGDRLKSILGTLTANRWMGALTGAFTTAVIQSSSVTTVLVVGFISAGLMSLSQSIGIIMGANIGTTITAQIIAFKVTRYAMLLVGVGFGLLFFSKKQRLRHHGTGIMGLGLVFLGMALMGEAMEPLRSYEPFLDWMLHMERPLLGIMAGALFTALVQSSSATTGIVIVMASQGFLALPAGIALIFGANVGTCATALLASIGKPREALRAAVVHVIFNLLGVVVWVAFIDALAGAVTSISPAASELGGSARLAADTPRQIANAHTIFNVANTLLFIGFSSQFARLVEWLVPDRPLDEEAVVRARYLDTELLGTPSLALDRVRLEILRLGDRVREMLVAALPAVLSGSEESLDAVAEMDDAVDQLHGAIITYLGRISQGTLTNTHTEEFLKLIESANSLENIGDVIETNLVRLGHERIRSGVAVSEATQEVIREFHEVVLRALDAALQAVTQKNVEAALSVVEMKKQVNRLAESAILHQAERLVAEEPNRLSAYTVEADVLQNLKRIFYFAKRMARAVVPPEGRGEVVREAAG